MIKTKIDIESAYIAGENKPYIFEDNNLKPVASIKAIELEESKAYALPVYKMSSDYFVEGLTEAPKEKSENKAPIDYLVQEVDELYRPTNTAYTFNEVKEPYFSPIKTKNSETLHVVSGSLFDALAINTVYNGDSVVLCPILKDFRVPKRLQKSVKYLVVWLNSHTNELVQTDRIEASNEIAEQYGNLCSVKVCIASAPERDQIETTWFEQRNSIKQAESEAKRLRSNAGRYPSGNDYFIYPNKEVMRVDHDGNKIPTGIMNSLFIDQIFQKNPEIIPAQKSPSGVLRPEKLNTATLKRGFIIGFRTATGATVLLPLGASILTDTPKHVVDSSGRKVPDSLALLANAGVPVSVDNMHEIRRMIMSSTHEHRGCGNGGSKPFPAPTNKTFSKDSLQFAEFY